MCQGDAFPLATGYNLTVTYVIRADDVTTTRSHFYAYVYVDEAGGGAVGWPWWLYLVVVAASLLLLVLIIVVVVRHCRLEKKGAYGRKFSSWSMRYAARNNDVTQFVSLD